MAIIYLTRGFTTTVDDETWFELNQYSWYASGPEGRPARRLRAGPRKLIYLYHQVLCVLPWVLKEQGFEVDHIDNDPLNNQRQNLRLVTKKENARNKIFYGFRQGICFDYTHGKWKAYLDQPDLQRINIGTYVTEVEALAALNAKKQELGLENN